MLRQKLFFFLFFILRSVYAVPTLASNFQFFFLWASFSCFLKGVLSLFICNKLNKIIASIFSVSHGQSTTTPYGGSQFLYSAAALYPGAAGSLTSYNPNNYDGGNESNRSNNNNSTGRPSTNNVDNSETSSPGASVGRVRTGGSSVGSEGDISSTLSPGNGSSGVRETPDSQLPSEPGPRGFLHRWENTNGAVAAALEAVVGRNSREDMEHHMSQMVRSSSLNPGGTIHEDVPVWRPYGITPSTT